MTSTYGELKFGDSQFLVFMNRILALIMVYSYITIVKQPTHKTPLYKYVTNYFVLINQVYISTIQHNNFQN